MRLHVVTWQIGTFYLHFCKFYKHKIWSSGYLIWGDPIPTDISGWSYDDVMPGCKTKTLYIYFQKTCNSPTSTMVAQVEGLPFTKLHVPFMVWSRDVTWQNKIVKIHFHKTWKYQTWQWWLRILGSHSQSCKTFYHMVAWYATCKIWKTSCSLQQNL